jgi:hypothetical protein
MLEVIRNSCGDILACLEWYLVNSDGTWNEKGEFVWIEQLEISSSVNGNGIGLIKQFIKKITDQVPWAKAGYFKRLKYDERIRLYSRDRWIKLLK